MMSSIMVRTNANWVIAITLILACSLAIMPLPEWMIMLRPEWVPLVLIYWIMALPYRVGLTIAWGMGFFVDVLEGSLLGLNGLCYVLVAWLCISLYQRLRMFTLLQQSGIVFVFIGIIQILNLWILSIAGLSAGGNLTVMIPALTSAIIWPFIFVTLRSLRRAFRVS